MCRIWKTKRNKTKSWPRQSIQSTISHTSERRKKNIRPYSVVLWQGAHHCQSVTSIWRNTSIFAFILFIDAIDIYWIVKTKTERWVVRYYEEEKMYYYHQRPDPPPHTHALWLRLVRVEECVRTESIFRVVEKLRNFLGRSREREGPIPVHYLFILFLVYFRSEERWVTEHYWIRTPLVLRCSLAMWKKQNRNFAQRKYPRRECAARIQACFVWLCLPRSLLHGNIKAMTYSTIPNEYACIKIDCNRLCSSFCLLIRSLA